MAAIVATPLSLVPESVYPGISATSLEPTGFGHTGSMATPELRMLPPALIPLPAAGRTDLRRRELGAFLRSRRERVKPEDVGVRYTRRRRTPGLRREEVAQLAGVGVTWYTWLEQGRDINPSAQVLDAISRTLQFDPHEHSHLFTLAGFATPTTVANQCLDLCPNARTLIEQLEPYPASIVNDRLDLLAYNCVYASFFDDLDSIPDQDRNYLWLAFTDPGWRKVMVDWEDQVATMVAEYRAAMAQHLDEPAWETLVARLHRASPEFTAVWERHDVQTIEGQTKRALHPTVGLLTLEYTNLWLGQRLGTRIVAFTPADELTRRRLEILSASLNGA
jgi:transcriptional regulator with XRE-family HTH domain